MQVRWKKTGPTEFVALWQGRSLSLFWQPSEHNWALRVDGRRVDRRWDSASAAVDTVEWMVGRLSDPQPSVVGTLPTGGVMCAN